VLARGKYAREWVVIEYYIQCRITDSEALGITARKIRGDESINLRVQIGFTIIGSYGWKAGSVKELVHKAAILVRGTSRGDKAAHLLPEYR
jgi:hypothetical protein